MAFDRYFKAMEEQTTSEDTTVVLDPQEAAIVSETAEVAENLADVQERLVVSDSQAYDIEAAQDETDSFAKQVEIAETSVEDGGMDQTAAAVLEVSTEAFHRRMSIKRTKPTGTGLEAFGGVSTRLRATKMAIEENKSAIKKGAEKIKEWFAKFMEFIKTTIDRIGKSLSGVSTLTTKVLEKLKGLKAVKRTVEVSKKLADKVKFKGKTDPEAVQKSVQASAEFVQDVVKETGSAIDSVLDGKVDQAKQTIEKLSQDKRLEEAGGSRKYEITVDGDANGFKATLGKVANESEGTDEATETIQNLSVDQMRALIESTVDVRKKLETALTEVSKNFKSNNKRLEEAVNSDIDIKTAQSLFTLQLRVVTDIVVSNNSRIFDIVKFVNEAAQAE